MSKITLVLVAALLIAGCAARPVAFGPVATQAYIRWCIKGDILATHAAMLAGLADADQRRVYVNLQRGRAQYLKTHGLPACPE